MAKQIDSIVDKTADFPHSVDLGLVIPAELVGDVVGKLHYVSEKLAGFQIADSNRTVHFRLRAGSEDQLDTVALRLREVATKVCRSYRSRGESILVSQPGAPSGYSQDPHQPLEAEGQLHRYGNGRYGLGPHLVALVEGFDRQFLKAVRPFLPEAHQFPSIVGGDLLSRCRYIKSFPHSLSLVQHLREDLEAIQDFAEQADWQDGHLKVAPGSLAQPETLLSPTVCFHCYAWLADSRQTRPRIITARGKCFRFESGNLRGLERLWDFSMREMIFVGPKEFILEQRKKVIEACAGLLDRWKLSYEIKTATDPFFIDDFSQQSAFQRAFDLKFEVRAALPYRPGSSVAIGSFNIHQDFFGRSFSISSIDGQPVHTGCVGFGLERVALAVVAQHGPNPADWPANLRADLVE